MACPETIGKLMTIRAKAKDLNIDGGYNLYTLKKPFELAVRELIADTEFRLAGDFLLVLQSMLEHNLISIFSTARLGLDERDTLLKRDLQIVLKQNARK